MAVDQRRDAAIYAGVEVHGLPGVQFIDDPRDGISENVAGVPHCSGTHETGKRGAQAQLLCSVLHDDAASSTTVYSAIVDAKLFHQPQPQSSRTVDCAVHRWRVGTTLRNHRG